MFKDSRSGAIFRAAAVRHVKNFRWRLTLVAAPKVFRRVQANDSCPATSTSRVETCWFIILNEQVSPRFVRGNRPTLLDGGRGIESGFTSEYICATMLMIFQVHDEVLYKVDINTLQPQRRRQTGWHERDRPCPPADRLFRPTGVTHRRNLIRLIHPHRGPGKPFHRRREWIHQLIAVHDAYWFTGCPHLLPRLCTDGTTLAKALSGTFGAKARTEPFHVDGDDLRGTKSECCGL